MLSFALIWLLFAFSAHADGPTRTFKTHDPILTSVRTQIVEGADCGKWMKALVGDRRDMTMFSLAKDEKKQNWDGWKPFEGNEKDAVEDCDHFPCDVKLDSAETEQMKSTARDGRVPKYLSLVYARVRDYLKSGQLKPFEFPGGISDPWTELEKQGLKSTLEQPKSAVLEVRRIDFKESRMRPIRQILDRRTTVSQNEASVWIRTVYNDHYFDGWGEWGDVRCDTRKKSAIVTLAVLIELDLLKKTDLWSSLSKGSMRDGVERLSQNYEDQWFEELKAVK